MDRLKQDLVSAMRNLRKSPGYAAVTVLTLALGIGANTAIFSVVNAVILRPLAYANPGRLVFITSQFPNLGFDKFWISPPEFVEFRDRNKAYSGVGAYRTTAVNLGTQEQPRRVNTAVVSSELMPVLGRSGDARPAVRQRRYAPGRAAGSDPVRRAVADVVRG